MLPTTAIKAATPMATGKNEKDSTDGSLEASFSAYFSQMMGALPLMQAKCPVQLQPPEPSTAPPQSVSAASTGTQTSSAPAASGLVGKAPAAPAQGTPAQGTPAQGAPASHAQVQASQTQGGGSTAPQTAAATGQAAAPPATPATSASAAPSARTATAADGSVLPTLPPAPDATLASKAPVPQAPQAPAPEAKAAAPAQAALAQAYPGGKFQMQYDDQNTPAPAPLTELSAQAPLDPKTTVELQAGSLPDASLTLQPATPVATASGLESAAALFTLQAPLAGQTALLAAPAPEPAAASDSAAGALSGNVAAAQAVGAGGLPGASGAVRVTAPAAAESSASTGQESLLSQVDGTIRWLVKNQDQGAELQLHPESLGRIQIKLNVDGTVVHAKVWASEPSAVPVLQDHRSFLEASLKSQGLTLGSFDLQQGRREEQTPMPAAGDAAPVAAAAVDAPGTGQETPAAAPMPSLHAYSIEYVA